MMKPMPVLLLSALCVFSGCQRPQETGDASSVTATATQTPVDPRVAVRDYVQKLPDRAVYQVDSAQVVEADTQYQVLVPRTDWAGRMPNKAAFNVDKRTGEVSVQMVK